MGRFGLGSRPWRVNLSQIAGRCIWHNSCSLVLVAFSGHQEHHTPEERASCYPCHATNSMHCMSQLDSQCLPKPCGRSRQNTFSCISVSGNLYLATLTCHRDNFQEVYNTRQHILPPLFSSEKNKNCRNYKFSSEKT